MGSYWLFQKNVSGFGLVEQTKPHFFCCCFDDLDNGKSELSFS